MSISHELNSDLYFTSIGDWIHTCTHPERDGYAGAACRSSQPAVHAEGEAAKGSITVKYFIHLYLYCGEIVMR